MANDEHPVPVIRRAYTLVSFIPYFVDDADGSVWLERAWHRDFVRHMTYLKRLTMVAPRYRRAEADGADLVRVDVPPGAELRFVSIPKQETTAAALAALPRTARVLWDAVRGSDIVHSGIAGWPYPIGWLANAAALVQRKALVVVVESAPWRLTTAAAASPAPGAWKRRARAVAMENVGRWFVNRATISFFTQPAYRETLLTRQPERGFVLPASWIDDADVIDAAGAAEAWRQKQLETASTGPRFLFAGRLVPDKGVDVLLGAVEQLRRAPGAARLAVDFIGEGSLRDACVHAAAASANGHGNGNGTGHGAGGGDGGPVRVRVLDPVPYGPRLFELVRRYHAILVPSISDEQPRIIFDAFSQAVPAIASDTDGLRPHVIPGRTGLLVRPGDPTALARALTEASQSPATLERLGLSALAYASTITHARMHHDRWRLLAEHIGT